MTKLTSVEEGARHLLTLREQICPAFSVQRKGEGEYTDTLTLDNKATPLLYWRFDPRIKAIFGYADEDASAISALNVYSFVGRDMSLDELIYRELDIAEYILHSQIIKVTAFINGPSCNLIALVESGAQANLELGATMAEGSANQCQHRLITSRGMASDRPVDVETTLGMLNVFASDGTHLSCDPGDIDLWGLDFEDSYKAYCVRALVSGACDLNWMSCADLHLRAVLRAVHLSAELSAPVMVGGCER